MDDRKTTELIDRYLNDELAPEQRAAMDARIAEDPAFRAEVELHRQLGTALADTEQHALFSLLQEIDRGVALPDRSPAPAGQSRRWLYLLAVVFLAAILGAVFLFQPKQQPSNPATQQPSNPPTPQPSNPAPPQPPSDSVPAARPRPSGPIAALDRAAFRPNRLLEPLAGAQVRGGGDVDVVITAPANGVTLRRTDGRVRLRVAGTLESDELPTNDTFEAAVFGNREADFLANRPAARLPVRVQVPARPEDSWEFIADQRVALTPGLYYVVIWEKTAREPLRIVKVLVR